MSIRIDLLTQTAEASYQELLSSLEHTLLYTSLVYRVFLKRILVESEDFYFLAYESERIVGALPSFIKYSAAYGNVLNSLPFYGSNGGVIVSPEASDKEAVKKALIDAYHALAIEKSVIVSTLVSNPLNPDQAFYEENTQYTLRDERIGQLSPLPRFQGDASEPQSALLSMLHGKTRNSISKAQRSDIAVRHSAATEDIQALAALHRENIEAVGGLAKPDDVFAAVQETFAYDRDYRVYVAEKDGMIIGALLIFFHNRTAEYYTPATAASYRVYQPMSLLIYEAMQEAARRGCRYWNWGGTWLTQGGVYDFKARWGTQDMPYFYYVREYEPESRLRQLKPQDVLAAYPYFYVLPFSVLKKD